MLAKAARPRSPDDAGRALKAAGGELFVFGHGASKVTTTGTAKGLAEEFLEFEGKKMNVQRSLAISNAKRFGNDVLTNNQWDEFLGHLFKGKNAEFNYFDDVTDEMLDAFNVKFPSAAPVKNMSVMKKALTEKFGREASDIEVRSAIRTQTINKLESVSVKIPEKIENCRYPDKLATRSSLMISLIKSNRVATQELVDLMPTVTKNVPTVTKNVSKGKPFASTEQITAR